MTIKEKRLQILSLAMDINEKYGAVCFVDYYPHTNVVDVSILNKPWVNGNYEKPIDYYVYGDDSSIGRNVVRHDELIAILQDILENGLKK